MDGSERAETLEELIFKYFRQGYKNLDMLEILNIKHKMPLSLSTLKRLLKGMGLRRRGPEDQPALIKTAIEEELLTSGSLLGYRKIWRTLQQKGYVVKRNTVMEMVRDVDPQGVQERKRHRLRRRYFAPGPDFVWHLDGYDKLKPFGFSIHGCIDGFSRRILWLEVGTTNKNPEIVAGFYLNALRSCNGIPMIVRTDDGTENSIIEPIQMSLRSRHDDEYSGEESFKVGRSTANQRIEAFWSQLIKDRVGWWRNFFKDLSDQGHFDDTDPVQVDCIRFCFMDLIRNDLTQFTESWNSHIISSSKDKSLPRGRPDVMYHLPHLYNTQSFLQDVDQDEVDEYFDASSMLERDYSSEFEEFANTLMFLDGVDKENDAQGRFKLYYWLLEHIEQY